MSEKCKDMQERMSGYLDNELDADSRAALERHTAECAQCRNDLDAMSKLIAASDGLNIEMPPDEVWDEFLDNVYSRIERRTGFLLLFLGAFALSGWALYYMAVTPWASTPVKLALGAVLAGLTVLFLMVLRQRLVMRKTDRYSRDVKR